MRQYGGKHWGKYCWLWWVLSPILWVLSWLYWAVVTVRGWLYDQGWCQRETVWVPTLCVGNLAVGGTGKTPLTGVMASAFSTRCRVAILSRGYGRRSRGFRVVLADSRASEVGDEPLELRLQLPQRVRIAVCEDRVEGCRQLLTLFPDTQLVILDDAYQYRALRASASLLLTSYSRPFTKDSPLPFGTLRDTPSQRRRADVVILTKVPPAAPLSSLLALGNSLLCQGQGLCITSLRYDAPKPLFPSLSAPDRPLPQRANAQSMLRLGLLVGIADPSRFISHVEGLGHLIWKCAVRDHAPYTLSILKRLERKAQEVDRVYTTGKDAARLRGILTQCDHPNLCEKLWVVPITLHWHYGDPERLVETLMARMGIDAGLVE